MKSIFAPLLVIFTSFLGYSQNTITISSITITGNKITKEDIVLREIVFSENSSFSISDLKQKIKAECKRNATHFRTTFKAEYKGNAIVFGAKGIARLKGFLMGSLKDFLEDFLMESLRKCLRWSSRTSSHFRQSYLFSS